MTAAASYSVLYYRSAQFFAVVHSVSARQCSERGTLAPGTALPVDGSRANHVSALTAGAILPDARNSMKISGPPDN